MEEEEGREGHVAVFVVSWRPPRSSPATAELILLPLSPSRGCHRAHPTAAREEGAVCGGGEREALVGGKVEQPADTLGPPKNTCNVGSDLKAVNPLWTTGPLVEMEDIFYPAHEPDILQLLHGPRDERDLSKCLAGEACSLTMRDHVTVQASPDPILNLLDFIPKDGRRCGMRRARKRKIFPLKSLCSKPARGKRHCQRKNNAHWTLNEVAKLVKGISKYGVSRWTKLKRDYFPESLRTAVHLKDKWRNLLKACGINITSRKKGKTQKTMLRPLDTRLIEQIKQVNRAISNHALRKSRDI
uniref:Myb-like domain-containing protein n=1 Tax=Oryza brachyantha TaxID=4533 RepID=J3N2Z0_ORYBR